MINELLVATFPFDEGLLRRVDAPQVNVDGVACHSHALTVLPGYVEAVELRVDL